MPTAYRPAAEAPLASIPEYADDPLVSSGITGNSASSIFDSALTRVDGRHVKVVAWYDNEWGFSNRVSTHSNSSPPASINDLLQATG
ncbi:hypothetical protein GCM10010381_57540 [Streptomyces xantholiticus]|nr:hypothetical protein GCM10010381_57540 [Streptomyces xantholiticus]